METLPMEIVNEILEYEGRIKYKNGKYINKIHKYDDRYDILLTIQKPFIYPVPILGILYYSIICFTNTKYSLTVVMNKVFNNINVYFEGYDKGILQCLDTYRVKIHDYN